MGNTQSDRFELVKVNNELTKMLGISVVIFYHLRSESIRNISFSILHSLKL